MTPAQLLITNEFVSTPGFSGIPGSIEMPVDDKVDYNVTIPGATYWDTRESLQTCSTFVIDDYTIPQPLYLCI